tara:strand:+ start:279 stop:491 length:213 start_codon:yes stop_codon:yes gene_type:complete
MDEVEEADEVDEADEAEEVSKKSTISLQMCRIREDAFKAGKRLSNARVRSCAAWCNCGSISTQSMCRLGK